MISTFQARIDAGLVEGIISVWSADKNQQRQYRDLKIRESLRPIFLEWAARDAAIGAEHLIHWHGSPVKSIKRAWRETLEKAGITRRVRPYDLRHAHAAEYTAVGRDNSGEMVLVEFDETDRHGNLVGLMWRRLEVIEVEGRWCGKGLAKFEGVKVEVVK